MRQKNGMSRKTRQTHVIRNTFQENGAKAEKKVPERKFP
jgi:hypothetical protein